MTARQLADVVNNNNNNNNKRKEGRPGNLMTDLSRILPDFPIGQYARLLPAIERQQLTTADLLTLEVADIGKRTQLSLLDVKRFCGAVLEALHVDLGVSDKQQQQQQQKQQRPQPNKGDDNDEKSELLPAATRYKSKNNGEHNKNENKNPPSQLKHTLPELTSQWRTISTLDETLDRALGGGIPTGRVTEITGESGAGKTQFLLTLLLAVQLPPSRGGLGRPALYISTEAPLSTVRLSQILRNHPRLRDLEEEEESKSTNNKNTSSPTEDEDENGEKKTFIKKPSLDHIASTVVPDLESQDHILSFQVPVEVARRGVGLLVLDSVAANYRVEFERTNGRKGAAGGGAGLAARSNELVRLGRLLHDLARQHDLAVVVSNQVADRFPSLSSTSSSSTAMATPAPPKSSLPTSNNHTTMMTVTQRNHHNHHHHHPAYMGGGGGMKQSQESPLASRSRGLPSALTATTAMLNAEPTSSVPLPSSSADMLEDDEAAMAAAVAVRSSMPEPAPEPRSIFSASNNNHEHQQQYQHQQQQPSALLLDHQQRWFTGWGDEAYYRPEEAQALKTPSLGLVWSTQIATRIALVKKPVYGRSREVVFEDERVDEDEGAGSAIIGLKNWRRWMKVVFAPHVPPSSSSFSSSGSLTGRDSGDGGDGDGPVEFEITMGGLKAVEKKRKGKEKESR